MILLYYYFIKADVSVGYVWKYTNTSYSLTNKISGVLGGLGGSLLFWIWMIIIPWFYIEIKSLRRPIDKDLMLWFRVILYATIAILLFILSLHKIFEPTPYDSMVLMPQGQGLNPLLQTFWMTIHPPVVFIAYGFLAIPFAAGLAHLITGNPEWTDLSLNWSRAGWLFLTLGIGIGALWAYIVLGWGGYWAWDPVETSSLLPWILLTGFLHVQLMYKRKKDYPIVAPVLGALTFLLVIFATFTTRAGGLWVSVHDFGDADLTVSPLNRLIEILSTNQTVLIYFIFMVAIIALTLTLILYRYKKTTRREPKTYALHELIGDDILMLITVFLAILVTVVTLTILILGINGLSPDNFNTPVGALVLISVMVLTVCLTWRNIGRRNIVIILVGTLIASVIGYLIYSGNQPVAASLPIMAVALVGTCYKVVKSFNYRKAWRSMRLVSAHLIHLSVVLIVIGYVSSNYMVTEELVSIDIGTGNRVNVGSYALGVNNIDSSSEYIFVEIEVWKGDSFKGMIRPGLILIDGQVRNEIKIHDTWLEDLYVTYNYDLVSLNQNIVDLEVKILPLMKVLWGGMVLMSFAIILRVIVEKTTKRKTPVRRELDEPETKDDEYYETLVDEELEKMNEVTIQARDDSHYEELLDKELE
jgi:cytochrome c-type biogenesis protein CcmF